MKACFIRQCAFPDVRAIRTKKMVESLSSEGWKTMVLCRNFEGEKSEEDLGLVSIRRFSKVASWPFPFNPLWFWWIFKHGRKADVLIVGDLRLFYPAYLAAKLAGLPLVFDLAEYFPGLGEVEAKKGLEKFFKAPWLVNVLEMGAVRLADVVWVVVDEQCERFVAAGIPRGKLSVVSNTPPLENMEAGAVAPASKKFPQIFTITYVGLLSDGRGVQNVIRAMGYLREMTANVRLVIVGDGEYKAELEQLTHDLHVENMVQFKGYMLPEEWGKVLAESSVGVIPHIVKKFWNNTVPNKLFDYMKAGIPVLSSPAKPTKRIIAETGCGFVAPEDPLAMAKIILEIQNNPEGRIKAGENGRRAVLEKYNWKVDAQFVKDDLRRLTNLNA